MKKENYFELEDDEEFFDEDYICTLKIYCNGEEVKQEIVAVILKR